MFDHSTFAEAVSTPGIDPRQWVSFGIVAQDTKDSKGVNFNDADGKPLPTGVLVEVILQPSNVVVPCRVAGGVAGNGESEYYPFLGGDEVLVVIPEGDEMAGCTIIGRLNNEIDTFPTGVGGADASKNNIAFRRMRVPYILETSSTYMVRSADKGAFLTLDGKGNWTLSNGDGHYLSVSSSLISLHTADNSSIIQIDVDKKQVRLEADTFIFLCDAAAGKLYTPGTMEIGTAGNPALWHCVTLESVVNLFSVIVSALGVASGPGGPVGAATLATFLAALNTPVLAQAFVGSLLLPAGALPLAPVFPLITAAMAIPPTPATPGMGTPGFKIG